MKKFLAGKASLLCWAIVCSFAAAEAQPIPIALKVSALTEKVPLNASASDFESALELSKVSSAHNGFASFNLLLRAASDVEKVSVRLAGFNSETGDVIRNKTTEKDKLFRFVERPIELFFTRYLEIKGLSKISYEVSYDERHVPKKFRRPWSGDGVGKGGWKDRPHANRLYPDILVPLEVVPEFAIKGGQVQSVIADVFISDSTEPGTYRGTFEVMQSGKTVASKDVQLEVLDFKLPDVSPAGAMLYIESGDISNRYLGDRFPSSPGQQSKLNEIVDNHFRLARRHGVELFDKNEGVGSKLEDSQPRAEWLPRLSGKLFSEESGYSGPGLNQGSSVFFVGTYGNWPGKQDSGQLKRYASSWNEWFSKNAPKTEAYFYVADESSNWEEQEQWAKTIKSVAPRLKTFATVPLPKAVQYLPSLDAAASWFNFGSTNVWESAVSQWRAKKKDFLLYNGRRPLTGSFATEDDGVALRVLTWSQIKVGVKRWFFWNGTYYKNFQGGTGETDVFQSAHTFGGKDLQDPVLGENGWNHSNGDGVLFYPGTDRVFPRNSYSLDGPIASLRLKLWRLGIEDGKYIELAFAKNPNATRALMQQMVPKILWQVGVAEENDPTWKKTDVSWDVSPKAWEDARTALIKIIQG